jgi:hypothetical protein
VTSDSDSQSDSLYFELQVFAIEHAGSDGLRLETRCSYD